MSQSKKAVQFRYKSTAVGNFFRKSATVIVFPFAFLWFFLIAWNPKLKKLWNPEPIKVYVVGRNLKNPHHGVAYVVGNNPRYRKQRLFSHGNQSAIIAEGLMFNPPMDFAFRVDRPEALANPSRATIRALRRKFEELGYEVRSLKMKVNGQEFIHML